MENAKMVAAVAATAFNEQTVSTFYVLEPYTGQPARSVYDLLPSTMLSEHFALREFVVSGTAIRHGIDNMPPDDVVERLEALCWEVLEPMRHRFGKIRITSGYRCAEVNKLVGGVPTSQHVKGEAADISVGNLDMGRKMYEYVRTNLDFDQLILEYRRKTGACWLHVSYRGDGKNRRQAFEIKS